MRYIEILKMALVILEDEMDDIWEDEGRAMTEKEKDDFYNRCVRELIEEYALA